MVLQKCEQVLAVCLIAFWRDIEQTRLARDVMVTFIVFKPVLGIRTITSRKAGSKVPLNVRCSLYRNEIEMAFSGFCKMFAET